MAAVVRHSVSRFEDNALPSDPMSSNNVDKVVQSVTNATKRLSQISTSTNTSSKKRKSQNKIGPWKLGRTLGRGSTGRVRLAKNIETGQLAAIKIVPKSNFKKLENPKYKHKPESGDGEDDAVQRLPYGIEREIIIMKLMSHPNIMALYDVWENKNDLYLILEYIEGGELFDYLIKKGKLQEYEAVNYFKQIINGINYLHQFNICHRDLKPENLLLDFNKNIKIADFGMAALEVNEKLLETSCGSPHYASPEIVAGKNYHGAPSDIWSCGIILFALLTGHLPFDDENIRKLLLKVQSGKFVMPHELSWEAKDLITKMLKVNPLDRIEIESILKHPLLTKYPEPSTSYASTTTLDIRSMNIKPIQSVDQIDKEILTNLSVLFHNCDKRTVISRLTSPGKNPEKMFYYLLMKYRNDHIAKVGATESSSTQVKAGRPIPRSTSIVHTIIFDDATGEPITETTNVEQVAKSSSIYENKSLLKSKSSKHVLGNITNTKGNAAGTKEFKASTSFNRKVSATHKCNQFSRSRNASSRSLKSHASRGTNTPTPPKSNSPIKESSRRPQQQPPTLNESGIPQRSPNRAAAKQAKVHKSSKPDNQSILKFETILDEVFSDTQDKENEVPSRASSQRKREGALARKERELAEKVHQRNEAREGRLRKEEQARRELEEEQKCLAEQQRKQEQKRQALAEKQKSEEKQSLEAKQRQAIARLKKHESGGDFAGLMKSNRNSGVFPPPPIQSSLDPRNSIARARTLGPVPSRRTLGTATSPQVNENTSKVLHKFGIDVAPSPKKFTSDFKTSSSRNLAALLSPSPSQNITKTFKTSSSRNLADYLHGENDPTQDKKLTVDTFNEIEHEKLTQVQSKGTPNRRQSTQSSYYKSMLNDIDEDNAQGKIKRTPAPSIKDEDLNSSRMSLIPNPRFSRFSFGGLLEPRTVTNEEGDITIMSQTLNNSSTVVRRSNKSSSTFAGLGIKVRDTIKEDDEEEENEEDKFVSINTTAIDDGDRSGREEGDYSFDDSHSEATTIDSDYSYVAPAEADNTIGLLDADLSNFDVISSRTADVGKVTNQKPSIVSSRETLIAQKHVSNDETIRADDNDENVELQSSFRAHVNDEFDANDDYSLAEGTNDNQGGMEDAGEPAFESDFKRSRLSTGIFSTAQLPRSPHVQLADSTGDETDPVRKKSVLKDHVITSPVQDTFGESKQPLFRRFSTKAKRDAPTVPVLESTQEQEQVQPKGHNRFSRISAGSRNLFDMHNKPPPPQQQHQSSTGKSNWFKKFFQSLTSSSKPSKPSSNTEANINRLTNRDIKIVESSLKSTDLIRLIKDQMELKELEGSVNKVGIDEEFGLITGTVPKKFAHGKKLKFRIEVVDLTTSSSLHVMRMSGNEKGFENLVKIVTYIIKKEEQKTSRG
ncbi:HSL1 [Candida margitis]|uniref:HSL1 n=1 Tax=Candida margitis TaxID=1775924 RepID=UPI00222800E1|nr:HSL1 [Candida margitis]KAI5967184.1 HSL1 [Candida margitis]